MNTANSLFKGNLPLRQAVNYAVNRQAVSWPRLARMPVSRGRTSSTRVSRAGGTSTIYKQNMTKASALAPRVT